jgi:hypothetical protein
VWFEENNRSILRAGKMRVWSGPHGTAYKADGEVVNTSGDDEDMEKMPLQEDPIPQTIFPVFFPQQFPSPRGTGAGSAGHYHPLFMGTRGPSKKDGVIRVMADHGHEGVLVTVQDTDDRTEWPETSRGVQPKPVIVANGINKITGKSMPLVSAYDGAPAGVGHIVAHTTWHHFVNVNLHGFLVPEASDAWAAISEYFVNLAWWLGPQETRRGGALLYAA